MRNLGLDALVKASRLANSPAPETRERARRRLEAQFALGLTAVVPSPRPDTAPVPSAALSGAGLGARAASVAWTSRVARGSALLSVGLALGLVALSARKPATVRPPPEAVPFETAASVEEPVIRATKPPDPPASSQRLFDARRAAPRVRQGWSAAPLGASSEARSLEGELTILRSARRALDANSAGSALALLDQYRAEFPRGVLGPEWATLRVLALCAAGRVASAKRARDEFVEAQPGSPLADGLRSTCAGER